MIPDEYEYYATHSVDSDPGDLRHLLDSLPKDPPGLLGAVGGLVLHAAFVEPLGLVCPPASADDLESRQMPEMLRRIWAREPESLARLQTPTRGAK